MEKIVTDDRYRRKGRIVVEVRDVLCGTRDVFTD